MLKPEKNLTDLRKSREASKPKARSQSLADVVAKINQRRMTASGRRSRNAPSIDEDSLVSRLNMRVGKEPQAANGSRAKLRDIIENAKQKRA
ncbi:hypothetical protein GFM44_15915 [Rhizobium leguminosarum bv. viciae]|nr:hypothetical protein [Rhizobium leguminosarum bv. viciae]